VWLGTYIASTKVFFEAYESFIAVAGANTGENGKVIVVRK